MPTYQNTKPLLPITGIIFLVVGILATAITAGYTIAYIADLIKNHHGTPLFLVISLIATFAGALMRFGKQTITTDQSQINKTLKLFGIKLFTRTIQYQDIQRIETAHQTDIRLIKHNQKTLIIDSLDPTQFTPITNTLKTQTNLPPT